MNMARTTMTFRSFHGFLLLAALCSAACGPETTDADQRDDETAGAGGEGNAPSELECPDPNDAVDPTAALDDLEDQDGLLLRNAGRNGGWWTAGDETPGSSIVPELSDFTGLPATPEAIPGGRCGSQFAMRVTGQGFNDWGALLGISLGYGTRPNGEEGGVPYDATGIQGVGFWARIGDTSTNQVRFALSDKTSEPDGGLCVENGGEGKECYDTFGVYLTQLDTTWRHYRVPFSGLSQENFGYPADALDTSTLYTVQFNFDSGAIFDLWVDDLYFF